jgi:hypothetical protein
LRSRLVESEGPDICLDVAAESLCLNISDAFGKARNHIEDVLARHYPCIFKIGICERPVNERFFDSEMGYINDGYCHMDALSILPAKLARLMERRLIALFDTVQGCHNKRGSGGEGISHQNPAPIFVYVAWARECDFAEWQRRQRQRLTS